MKHFYRLLLNAFKMGLLTCILAPGSMFGESNPLWTQEKIKNYLPHMTVSDVRNFRSFSDLVIIPIGALEQHADHLPIGTDFLNGVEFCKLVAQEREVLVVPVLMAGQSPYHMGFPGTISLSAETIIQVHMETVSSLIQHGFQRFIIMSAHGGNRAIVELIVDQINQKTSAVAVNHEKAIGPFLEVPSASEKEKPEIKELDRHAGTGETSNSIYLIPSLVQLDKASSAKIEMPEHLNAMLPRVLDHDPTAKLLFLAESLKPIETGKRTSSAEMSSTGVWGTVNPAEATLERGRSGILRRIEATVEFIDAWNALRP